MYPSTFPSGSISEWTSSVWSSSVKIRIFHVLPRVAIYHGFLVFAYRHASGLLPLCLSTLSYRLIRMSGSSAYGACFSSCVGRGAVCTAKNYYTLVPPPTFIRSVCKRIQEAYSLPAADMLYSRVPCARTLLFRRIFGQCAGALCFPGAFSGNVRTHSAFPACFRPMCKRTLFSRRVFWQCAGALCFPGAFSTDVQTHFVLSACFLAMCKRTLLSQCIFDRCADALCFAGAGRGGCGRFESRLEAMLPVPMSEPSVVEVLETTQSGKNARGAEII